MIHVLAQATQATTQAVTSEGGIARYFYFWSNIPWVALTATAIAAFIFANLILEKLKDLGGKAASAWFGWRSDVQKMADALAAESKRRADEIALEAQKRADALAIEVLKATQERVELKRQIELLAIASPVSNKEPTPQVKAEVNAIAERAES